MADIIKLVPGRSGLPENTSAFLREMADDIDAGKLTQFVAAIVRNGDYEMVKSSSHSDSLVLASLLHDSCIRDFRA